MLVPDIYSIKKNNQKLKETEKCVLFQIWRSLMKTTNELWR